MSASFYERACKMGAYSSDGGALDLDSLTRALILYAAGKVDGNFVSAQSTVGPPGPLTVAQRTDLDHLLATLPGNLLTSGDAASKAAWASTVSSILSAGRSHLTGFTTEALVKAALGV